MGVLVEPTHGDLTRFEYNKLPYMPGPNLANQRAYSNASMQNNPSYTYMLDGKFVYGEELDITQPNTPMRSTASSSPQSNCNGYDLVNPNQYGTPRSFMPCTSGSSHAFVVGTVTKDGGDKTVVSRPPKKKWIKEYLEEEPHSPMAVGVLESLVPVSHCNGDSMSPHTVQSVPLMNHGPPSPDYLFQHSTIINNTNGRETIVNNSGSPINGSPTNQSAILGLGRAGTREVHNKLEKNRRAHLKECFEILKRQLPASSDDKKTSNLSILGSAIRYIQVLRRKERECEHEMERLAREKIASQQRLSALQREINMRRPGTVPVVLPGQRVPHLSEERDERINGQVLVQAVPISISPKALQSTEQCSSPFMNGSRSPPTLNLSTNSHDTTQTFTSTLNLDDNMTAACTLASIASPRRTQVQGTLNIGTTATSGSLGTSTACSTLNHGTAIACGTLNLGTSTTCGTLNIGTASTPRTFNLGTTTSGTLNLGTSTMCGPLNLGTPTTCGTFSFGTSNGPGTINFGSNVPNSPNLSTPGTLNLSVKPSVLTVTTVPASLHQNVKTKENGISSTLGSALVHHPTHIQLPLSQVVGSTGLMVSPPVLQLLSTPGALRVLQTQSGHLQTNGGAGGLVVSTLAPLVVSQAGHLLPASAPAPAPAPSYNKIVDSMIKNSVPPLTFNGQYLNGARMKSTTAHTHTPHSHNTHTTHT